MLTDNQEKLLKRWNRSLTPREAFIADYKGCECTTTHCECSVKAYRAFQAKMARIRKKLQSDHPYTWTQMIKVKKTVLQFA